MNLNLEQTRSAFAEELRAVAPIRTNELLVEAFATVPRERFAGDGPWLLHPPFAGDGSYRTSDEDARRLYHNVLISIDPDRDLNIGQPSLWARLFDQLPLRRGARVLQVGAGTGYYSAIIAELVGDLGRVTAIEYDPELARRAAVNLKPWPQVTVVAGDGTLFDAGEADVIVSFAGTTHPPPLWLDRLAQDGELLLPLTGARNRGHILKIRRLGSEYRVTTLGPCGFFHCVGARDDREASDLDVALAQLAGAAPPISRLLRHPSQRHEHAWFSGADFCFAA